MVFSRILINLLVFICFEQTSVPFSEPAAFLELLPWHQLSVLSAKARSPTVARRITTVRHLTASPSTTAKGPSGQARLTMHICFMPSLQALGDRPLNELLPPFLCLRCLESGAGDVAFVDHLALESIDGNLSFYRSSPSYCSFG